MFVQSLQAKIFQSSFQCMYKVYKVYLFSIWDFTVFIEKQMKYGTASLYCTRQQSFYNHKDGLYDHGKIIRLYSKVVKAMYEVLNHDI